MANINLIGKEPGAAMMELAASFSDITGPSITQVLIDEVRGVLHVNVDGICVLRVCRCPRLIVELITPKGEKDA